MRIGFSPNVRARFRGFNYHQEMNVAAPINILRYPGGKQKHLHNFIELLPQAITETTCYMEPFVGGASVFFALQPRTAIISDINKDLIDLYRGIRRSPKEVWKIYSNFPGGKRAYYKIRRRPLPNGTLAYKAARTLYLNRTCFKGMWRHNSEGQFNVGYGGQSRRWVINEVALLEAAKRLKKAKLRCGDFEDIIDQAGKGDFLFIDPPYSPGDIEMRNSHYQYDSFKYTDHKRLAKALKRATGRGVKWAMTTSSHPKIKSLFRDYHITQFVSGTGSLPGIKAKTITGEILVINWRAKTK